MAQPSYSTLEVDPAQFAPQVAYSTEKQIPYEKTGLEFHDKSAQSTRLSKLLSSLWKHKLTTIFSALLIIVVCIAMPLGVIAFKNIHKPPSTPIVLPTLPTGTFDLPMTVPDTILSTCLAQFDSIFWSCTIASSEYDIFVTENQDADHFVKLGLANSSLNAYSYGMQAPAISFALPGVLGTDDQDSERGPTYFFQSTYDTLVILPEGVGNSILDSRASANLGSPQPGDSPWFCFWNSTLLDVYIYINLTASDAISASTSQSATSTATAAGSSSVPSSLPQYPKAVKVENSVTNSSVNPYCQQMKIMGDGSAEPVFTSSSSSVAKSFNITSRDGLSCGCTWLIT